MIEPVAVGDLMTAAMTGAGVVLFGALYALFFALAKFHHRTDSFLVALVAYAGLVFCVVLLARALNLTGLWQSVVVVMLLGYFVAPFGIWYLCVGTHSTGAPDGKTEHA